MCIMIKVWSTCIWCTFVPTWSDLHLMYVNDWYLQNEWMDSNYFECRLLTTLGKKNHVHSSRLHAPSSIIHVPSSIIHVPSSRIQAPSSILHVPSSLLHVPSSSFHVPLAAVRKLYLETHGVLWRPEKYRCYWIWTPPPGSQDHRYRGQWGGRWSRLCSWKKKNHFLNNPEILPIGSTHSL